MAAQSISLPVPQSVTAGAPMPTGHLSDLTVQVSGTFVGTVQLQGQLSGSGTAWINLGTAFTAASTTFLDLTTLAKSISALRANVTAYTSGQPVVIVAGH